MPGMAFSRKRFRQISFFFSQIKYNQTIKKRVKALDFEYEDAMQQEILQKRNRWRIVLLILAGVLLIAGVLAGMLWRTYRQGLQVRLLGDAWIVHEYGKVFEDPGAVAEFNSVFHDEAAVPVTVEGTVDTSKLGVHQLTYYSEYEMDIWLFTLTCKATQTRSVIVTDTKAPEIRLLTNPDYFTLPGGTYEEEGFTAIDNHDGDLTAAVQRTQTREQVTYRVTDSSGNVAEVTRKIEYSDPIPPEITLLGAPHIMLQVGTSYEEPGFTAEDNCDGDISGQVTVSGTVDTGKEGIYTVEYSVQDNYGNKTTAERTVFVSKMPPVPGVPHTQYETPLPSNDKVIYLTFDDGPTEHTPKLLDILDKYGVKATFFVVYSGNKPVLQRMAEAGHTVAIHSASHDYAYIYSSVEAYLNDLYITQHNIEQAIGVRTTMFRFPGGTANTISVQYCPGIMTELVRELTNRGFRYFDWHVDSKDAVGASSRDEIYYNAVSGIGNRKDTVILQHDTTARSVEAAEMIIQWGIANGYTFLPLTMESPYCQHGVRN